MIWLTIYLHIMAPNNKLNINMQLPRWNPYSTIITSQHLNIFACWINKKETLHYNKVKCIPYRFKLLYRASKYGNTATAFHKKCDNKGATNSEHIIPLKWDSSDSYTVSLQ